MARARASRSLSGRRLAALAVAAALVGCRQTVAFERLDDGGAGGGTSGASGNGGGGAGNGTGYHCPGSSEPINFFPEAPLVIVALDRTTSMMDPFDGSGSGRTKLELAQEELVKVVRRYAWAVRFAYLGFPGKPSSTPGSCPASLECCSFLAPPSVYAWGTEGATKFETDIKDMGFVMGDQRQTAAALSACGGAFNPDRSSSSRSLLLVTDGSPGCSNDACRDAQVAASTLAAQRADIRVLGLGPPSADAETCLRTLVTNPGGQYDNAGPSELTGKIDNIFRDLANPACTLDLNPFDTHNVNEVHLYQNNREVPPESGAWTFDRSNSFIKLTGDVCTTFLTSAPGTTSVCPH